MKMVKIYTKNYCGYCHAAKELLGSLEVRFQNIDVTYDQDAFESLKQETGVRTVPQIFICDKMIGGYTELKALHDRNELISLLTTTC